MGFKSGIASIVLCIANLCCAQQLQLSSGTVRLFPAFKSAYTDARTVAVWLPDGYDQQQKYAVLYMHDGQSLFDAQLTWNKQAWEADETAGQLIASGQTIPFIIVAIWNTDKKRHAEYFPQKPYETLSQSEKDAISTQLQQPGEPYGLFTPSSDAYLKFLTQELKPFIDRSFSVYKDRQHTFIAGSSMGALISMYALCEYPRIFGGAACLSTHWPGTFSVENNPIPDALLLYFKNKLPRPGRHRLYFDYGDQTLDALYAPFQLRADAILTAKGYTSKNWMTKAFPGADHSENAWKQRLRWPLQFLLGTD